MPRKPRIHYPGALYHVMVKGNNAENIFSEEIHKREYLRKLSDYKKLFDFKLFAYCVMDNHAHLLVEVKDTPLSVIMQRIQQVYTQWFNRRYGRTGHVFQQRYKALLCDKENYLLQLIKYIHHNPVKAKMCTDLNYKWSSHLHYVELVTDGLVDTDEVLRVFSQNRNQAIKQYLQLMEQITTQVEIQGFREFQPDEMKPFQTGSRIQTGRMGIDELIERVCSQEKVSIEEVIRRTRIQRISDIRKAIVLLSEKHCSVTNTLLAEKLNLSLSMISKIKSDINRWSGHVQAIIQHFEREIGE